jgi:hypothetical protein
MKHHWDNSCFKTNKHIEAFLKERAHLLASSKSEILREKNSKIPENTCESVYDPDFLLQFDRTRGSEIFISSIYAKQKNLNHLNQPKGTVLRLGDGTKVTIV